MLYKYPHLVDISKAIDYIPDEKSLYHIDPRNLNDTLCYVPSTKDSTKKIAEVSGGSVGHPSLASTAKGKQYHEHLVSRLIEVIEQLKNNS